jgi:hypothetical protein
VPDFRDSREALRAARAAAEEARSALLAARNEARRARAEVRRLGRSAADDDEALALAVRRAREAEARVATLREGAARAASAAGRAVDVFATQADPRHAAVEWDDREPVLLFPVRLETRWLSGELLVRVFPDDCVVDTFEPELSESEYDVVERYWIDVWRAGAQEAGQRAAWRALVASLGSGRADYAGHLHEPLNPAAERPVKAQPDDVVLVIATRPPPPSDATAIAVYWEAVWRADGNAQAIEQAHDALANAVGGNAQADALIEQYAPANLDESPAPPLERSDVDVQVSFLLLPERPAAADTSWQRPPTATLLPERFVLLGYQDGVLVINELGEPLPDRVVVGPDPSDEDGLRSVGGTLETPDEMRWLFDFDRAVADGLGFRVKLNDTTSNGVERLLVVGLRLTSDAANGKTELETLIDHLRRGRAGFDLVAQGTPTNNTEEVGSGLRRGDDPDASWRDPFTPEPPFTPAPDPLDRSDGEWLAQWLGIDPAVLAPLPGAHRGDQLEARAMQTALWPATLGYMLGTLMQPVFDERALDEMRRFFTSFVTGRGPVPAVRVGSQPYGILATTAFSRMSFDVERSFLAGLHARLMSALGDWTALSEGVAHVGRPGQDPQSTLLDIVGLHATSVEYFQRYAQSVTDFYNRVNLWGAGASWLAALQASGAVEDGLSLLRRLGYGGDVSPDILQRLFFGAQQRLNGPLIDDRPLSEVAPIRAYTADGRNYIAWLVDAARTSLETVRREDELDDDMPAALLYLLLRHAVLLGYWETSVRLRFAAGVLDEVAVAALRKESTFVHVAEARREINVEGSGSRFTQLYSTDAAVTGDEMTLVGDHITAVLGEAPGVRLLDDQLAALDRLRDVPTARLERLLAEHVDTCSHRLDSWMTGLVHERLATLGERTGVHLGAFGWLEDVRPQPRELTPVELDEDLVEIFDPDGTRPLVTDSSNAGHMHAPSLNHAVTAAVLRSGYLAHATPSSPDAFAVDLSSRRVRTALEVIEGMRNGQSLGALLGYRLERGLHDRHAVAEVDAFLLALRKAFPLVADRLEETRSEGDVPIEAIESRNVVDGLALVTHVRQTGNPSYPFDRDLPDASPAQAAAIDAEVASLLDVHDAIADLTLAEGVHQAVVGNIERAAATLDAFGRASLPLDPQVVQTPRSGIAITHRVAIHVTPRNNPLQSPITGMDVTPRAIGEPSLNAWLAARLPDPESVACAVEWEDPATGTSESEVVTQQDLGLQPLDVLALLSPDGEGAMGELDARVLLHVQRSVTPRPDAQLRIVYTARVPGVESTFFEIGPLVESLRALALRSRPLRASDAALPNEGREAMDAAVLVESHPATEVKDRLDAVADDLRTIAADPRLADPETNSPALFNGIDALLDELTDLLVSAASFGLPQTDWSDLVLFRAQLFADVLVGAGKLVDRFAERLDRFDELIDRFDALPSGATDAEQMLILQQAELVVATAPTSPLPGSPAAFKNLVLARRATFAQKRGQFSGLATTTAKTLKALLDAVDALLPIDALDAEGLDIAPFRERILLYATSMATRATAVANAIDTRMTAAQTALDAAEAAVGQARVAALEEAHRALLGDDSRVLPRVRLGDEHGAEWLNAVQASESGAPFAHLASDHDAPVDDWLHGLARVREKLWHWERVLLMSDPLKVDEPELTAIQFPHRDGDPWLGLEYPPGTVIDSDRLLYTAHYDSPFDPTRRQCGLLVDEWTEVLPAEMQTTGLAFHFNRPSSEPPQTWMLVVPPEQTGAWDWADIVDALHDALDAARVRAVEPDQLDSTAWARFLPAVVTATTLHPITIAVDYGRVNGSWSLLEPDDG